MFSKTVDTDLIHSALQSHVNSFHGGCKLSINIMEASTTVQRLRICSIVKGSMRVFPCLDHFKIMHSVVADFAADCNQVSGQQRES